MGKTLASEQELHEYIDTKWFIVQYYRKSQHTGQIETVGRPMLATVKTDDKNLRVRYFDHDADDYTTFETNLPNWNDFADHSFRNLVFDTQKINHKGFTTWYTFWEV